MSVSYKDYYNVLEVTRSATTEEIDKAYKKLARKHHPDLNQGDSAAEERFKDVNEAHEVLKDPEKRRLYDQLGPNWKDGQHFQNAGGFGGGGGGGDFSDFFEMLFRQQDSGDFGGGFGGTGFGGRPRARRGRDVEATLQISLEEVLRGGPQSITINTADGPKSLNVNIPAGIKDGGKLRLTGQGNNGTPNGDLYLIINYRRHAKFTVDGSDISTEISVFPWDAVLGAKVLIPTLEGNVEMNIPAGSNSGRKLRLKGKGLGAPTKRGDEYVVIGIKTPPLEAMSEKEKELWQAIAAEAVVDKAQATSSKVDTNKPDAKKDESQAETGKTETSKPKTEKKQK